MATAVNDRPPPTGEGLTFEKVWAMWQETDRKWQETDQRFQKSREEADQRFKEMERVVKKVSRQMGGLHNRFGELAEHLVAPGIVTRFNELGFHFDSIAGGLKILDEQGKIRAEIDLLLENGEYLVAVEIKSRPKESDIEHHIRRLEIVREYREKKHDVRKILGAIAGAVFGSVEKKAAIEAGFYVLEQSGDTMKMDIPAGFVPRKW
ncbi:MAG: hypothetical protein LBH20_10420 [Treponema sp.]|nr:hypothetical protein [Treponema sp.]